MVHGLEGNTPIYPESNFNFSLDLNWSLGKIYDIDMSYFGLSLSILSHHLTEYIQT